jgi:sporulation protein YlmC with PRC-barrel domain
MTDIRLGANVYCSDGPCGKVINVVVTRATRKVSHIVVEDQNLPEQSTREVPINKIADATAQLITLSCTNKELAEMPPFFVTRYREDVDPAKVTSAASNVCFPYSFASFGTMQDYAMLVNETGYDTVDVENITDAETSVNTGMEIRASDGKIGKLDELVLNPENGEITHILMREGHLWGKKEIVIPLSAVASAREGFIRLKINKKQVGELPTVPLRC